MTICEIKSTSMNIMDKMCCLSWSIFLPNPFLFYYFFFLYNHDQLPFSYTSFVHLWTKLLHLNRRLCLVRNAFCLIFWRKIDNRKIVKKTLRYVPQSAYFYDENVFWNWNVIDWLTDWLKMCGQILIKKKLYRKTFLFIKLWCI